MSSSNVQPAQRNPPALTGMRVAVVAVHGVADQREGDTARSIAELLQRLPPEGTTYDTAHEQAYMLKVEPVEALRDLQAKPSDEPRKPSFPSSEWFRKYWRQSYGSDFHRDNWSVQCGQLKDSMRVDALRDDRLAPGPDLTEFMLFKAHRNDAPPESWRSIAISLPRERGGASKRVDVYEMYWADLSRLSSSLPRIATELFTLLFRLSTLGRDTVRIALATMGKASGPWSLLRKTQTLLDWLFSRVLALLMLQLAMVALVILPLGLLRGHERWIAPLLVGSLVFAVYLVFAYPGRRWLQHWLAGLAFAGAAIAAAVVIDMMERPDWAVGALWLGTLTACYVPFMRSVDARFPFTAPIGWTLWALVLVGVVAGAINHPAPYTAFAMWIVGALRALEVLLVVIALSWAVMGTVMLVWFGAGMAASRSGLDRAHAIVSTGRLGLFASASFFLVLVMVLWALVNRALNLAVDGIGYAPMLFPVPGHAPSATLASEFLEHRYQSSTELFSVIATIDLLLLGYLLVFFLPSVLVELRSKFRLQPQHLGRWLSMGYDRLDTRAIRWLTALSALACFVAGLYLGWMQLHRLGVLGAPPELAGSAGGRAQELSREWLRPLAISAGSLMLALSAFGGLLSRHVPWLRAPLDVALDVDNHFREFPRNAIPRARIVARYMALMRHLDAQGYDRIVFVAHSQGTVITTELLRYMHARRQAGASSGVADPDAEIVARLAAKARLLTLGCPLRQLYAARFPTLYAWVRSGDGSGPRAAALGIARWVNAYTSGDYVGRWLWAPEVDAVDDPRYVRLSRQAATAAFAGQATEIDVCLGAGAHTHYFEVDPDEVDPPAVKVVDLIDALID